MPVVPAGIDQCLLQADFEREAVRQFGQRVVVGEEMDAFLGTLALGDVGKHGDVVREFPADLVGDGVDGHPLRVKVTALLAIPDFA